MRHQYVDREGAVIDERLFNDRIVRFLYSTTRERAPLLFRALTGKRASSVYGYLNFDLPLASTLLGNKRFLQRCGVDLDECVDPPEFFTTPRRIFERRVRYWECRPMTDDPHVVVSPADARVTIGSFEESSLLHVKEKFFSFHDLLGERRRDWLDVFEGGQFAVFRLTPDRYHYNHTPVAGVVRDIYELPGAYHACNPSAVVELVTPLSRNRRVVTVIDTDVEGGTKVGLVAMIEVVALMIGGIEQAYSEERYDAPIDVVPGMFLERGVPKSLYRPGSSTDILLFERGRVAFTEVLAENACRADLESRYRLAFAGPHIETDVCVRSAVARRVPPASS